MIESVIGGDPAAKVSAPARWEAVETNLKRYVASGVFYIHAKVRGKSICESTKTTDLAEARLARNKRLHEQGQLLTAGGGQSRGPPRAEWEGGGEGERVE